jgi:outer membrane protein assembly factor BamA
MVRVDPVLLAKDEDLSAKLTIGKDITQHFSLVYSQNLSGPRAQTWIANYQALQDLLIRGINLSDDNKLTLELRHDLKWGGGPPLRRSARSKDEKRLGNVTFEGSALPMHDLLKQVTKTGQPFSTYRMNEDLRKLRQFLADKDFLSSNVRAVREPRDTVVDVHFLIMEGPSITFVFQGAKVPKHIHDEIRQIWIRGFAENSSLRLSQNRLLRYFRDQGYLQAKLQGRDESPDEKTRRFVFDITAGQRFSSPSWVFKGVQPINLNATPGSVLENPKAIKDQIVGALWKEGYLNASASEPRLIIEDRVAQFEVSVEPGPRFTIGRVTAGAPDVLPNLPPGEGGHAPAEGIFTSAWLERARQHIVNKYWGNGFNDVEVTPAIDVPKEGTTVNIDFKIEPGKQQIVRAIEIEGQHNHRHILRPPPIHLLRKAILSIMRVLNRTRKNLYDTLLFRRVDLNVVEGDNGYIARTRLNEKPPWNFRYGFAVTDQLQTSDREFGATADFSYSNLFGKGITAGLSGKYTADTHEARAFSSLPVFVGKRVTTTGAVSRRET